MEQNFYFQLLDFINKNISNIHINNYSQERFGKKGNRYPIL